eukprot:6257864-Prorocentrum_lima.AAC.1
MVSAQFHSEAKQLNPQTIDLHGFMTDSARSSLVLVGLPCENPFACGAWFGEACPVAWWCRGGVIFPTSAA